MLGAVARADPAVLADVASDDPLGQTRPPWVRVDMVVGADARQPRMPAASTPPARDDTANGAELHGSARSGAGIVAARLTLVTLDCRPFDIATSVGRVNAAVYSPAVLRLRGQARAKCEAGVAQGHPSWAAELRALLEVGETGSIEPAKVAPIETASRPTGDD